MNPAVSYSRLFVELLERYSVFGFPLDESVCTSALTCAAAVGLENSMALAKARRPPHSRALEYDEAIRCSPASRLNLLSFSLTFAANAHFRPNQAQLRR
jgi:hypothetical protein